MKCENRTLCVRLTQLLNTKKINVVQILLKIGTLHFFSVFFFLVSSLVHALQELATFKSSFEVASAICQI